MFARTIMMKLANIGILLLMLLTPLMLLAQTGPGGVGSATNNVIWLDAGFGVYNDAGTTLASTTNNVQQWNDRSGNNRHASQGTLANRPNYIDNVINGNPVLQYTAANNDQLVSLGLTSANRASVWFVALYTSLPTLNPGLMQATATGNVNTINGNQKTIGVWVGNDNNVWGRGVQSDNTISNITKGITLGAGNYYVINSIYRNNRIDQYVNNQFSGNNATHNGTLGSWTDLSVGRQGTETWNGNIGEMFMFNIAVNDAQRIIIDNYLAAKYGLSLSTNDVYRQDILANGDYDFEVAGIGRVDASNIHNDAQGTAIVRILNPTNLNDNEFLMWGHNDALAEANNFSDVPAGVQARMDRVWRVSEVNASGTAVSVGDIDIRWNLNGLGAVTASDLRLLIDTDSDGLFNDETPIAGASSLGAGIFAFTAVPDLTLQNGARFTIGTINAVQTPLPVDLVHFNVEPENQEHVKIEWKTSQERNNAFYTVERSFDGYTWEVLRSIDGAGNANTLMHYSVLDENPYLGNSFYRLKQTDFNGRFEYSAIKQVTIFSSAINPLHIAPNPTQSIITVEGEPEILSSVVMLNAIGQKVSPLTMIKEDNPSILHIDLSNLPQGIYFINTLQGSYRVCKL